MCFGGSPKAPQPQPATEPLKDIDSTMTNASSSAAAEQARRRGFASVWTRYQKTDPTGAEAGPSAPGATTPKADKLGG